MAKEMATDILYKDKERGACGSSLFVWGGIYVWGFVWRGIYVGGCLGGAKPLLNAMGIHSRMRWGDALARLCGTLYKLYLI